MYLNSLEYMIVLAEEKNFTRAAERICISQPALSKAISKLEQDLGVALFNRKEKTVSLTAAGEIYLESARKMLSLRDTSYERIRNSVRQPARRLRIGVNRQFTQDRLSKILQQFYKEYPGPLPDVYEMDSMQARQMLEEGWLDASIVVALEEDLQGYRHYRLIPEKLAAILPDEERFRPLLQKYTDSIPIKELDHMPAIRNRINSTFDRISNLYFQQQGITPDYICEFCDLATAIHAVNSGFAMLYTHWHRAIAQGAKHVFQTDPPFVYYHYFCLMPDTELTDQILFLLHLLQSIDTL
ncbi:LysR family transcriptional regulator [Clostridium sp. MCC353]|uniref:LysR family transcriptional regulator n=1 Tax=Clostridium sp. MCC353 TaxID=2592646 RepID=UPI001C01067B|nr:LysR family transcriptional regulator [Clostridium sp. MCC353]